MNGLKSHAMRVGLAMVSLVLIAGNANAFGGLIEKFKQRRAERREHLSFGGCGTSATAPSFQATECPSCSSPAAKPGWSCDGTTCRRIVVPQSPPPQPMPAAKSPAVIGRGVLFHELTRLKVENALREKGKTASEAKAIAAGLTDSIIEAAADQAKVPAVLGDGTILQEFLNFVVQVLPILLPLLGY